MSARLQGIPIQAEDDALMGDILKERGDKTSIAALLDLSLSSISQQCDPDNSSHKSYYHLGKWQLWSIYMLDEEKGDLLWADLSTARERWRKRSAPRSAQRVADLAAEVSSGMLKLMTADSQDESQLSTALAARDSLNKIIDKLKADEAGDSSVVELKRA